MDYFSWNCQVGKYFHTISAIHCVIINFTKLGCLAWASCNRNDKVLGPFQYCLLLILSIHSILNVQYYTAYIRNLWVLAFKIHADEMRNHPKLLSSLHLMECAQILEIRMKNKLLVYWIKKSVYNISINSIFGFLLPVVEILFFSVIFFSFFFLFLLFSIFVILKAGLEIFKFSIRS